MKAAAPGVSEGEAPCWNAAVVGPRRDGRDGLMRAGAAAWARRASAADTAGACEDEGAGAMGPRRRGQEQIERRGGSRARAVRMRAWRASVAWSRDRTDRKEALWNEQEYMRRNQEDTIDQQ